MRKRIVIVGSRHRGWLDGIPHDRQEGTSVDRELVQKILTDVRAKNADAYVLTVGCDAGFGRMVKMLCIEAGIGVVEISIRPSERIPKGEYELLYLTRHAALCDIGEEFHVFVTRSRISQIEDLLDRLRGSNVPYKVYGETDVIEENH